MKKTTLADKFKRATIGTFEPNATATLNGKPYKGEPLVMIPESKWSALIAELRVREFPELSPALRGAKQEKG